MVHERIVDCKQTEHFLIKKKDNNKTIAEEDIMDIVRVHVKHAWMLSAVEQSKVRVKCFSLLTLVRQCKSFCIAPFNNKVIQSDLHKT